jgi:aminoglycoside phosphotransferase (APT) family kinase protein
LPCDTVPVRAGEELNVRSLTEYLRGKIEGVEAGVTVEQFPGGHSNLTYLLRTKENGPRYVLRRGPIGPVAPKAHDMAREFRFLEMLHPDFPQAPAVFLLCEDPAVVGSAFFIMERRRGIILRGEVPSELATSPHYPRVISAAFIDCLVCLHAIDIHKSGLVSLGKPEGFLLRQVQGWAERWNRALTSDLPRSSTAAMERVIRWLDDHMPPSPAPTLVHNDYKLDNVMLRLESEPSVEAVLDWEMAAIGDPLADVGLALCYWAWAQAPATLGQPVPLLTTQPDWYSRDQFAERYAQQSGRDLSHIRYYEVLGGFKLAVILQQIYYRFRRGQTGDPRFQNFDQRVQALVELVSTLTEKLA